MATTIKLKNGSGAPLAGDLVQGEPALDLTNKRLYTEDSGGTVIEVGTNPGTDVTFADNRKAIFGAGSDLEIYHNATDSVIADVGTGNLKILANDLRINNADSSKSYITGFNGAQVYLYHNGSPKLETTATGIDVTGDVNSDSVTTGTFTSTGIDDNATSTAITIDSSENVGIGTTSPNARLNVQGTFGAQLTLQDNATNSTAKGGTLTGTHYTNTEEPVLIAASYSTATENTVYVGGGWGAANAATTISFRTAANNTTTSGTERMRIDSSGDIRLTGTAPNAEDSISTVNFYNSSSSLNLASITGKRTAGGTNYGSLIFNTTSAGSIAERMRIDSSGNLLVGKDAIDSNVAGFEVDSDGKIAATRDGSQVAIFNRLTSDGDIAVFRKDGTTVGSIGTEGGDLAIGNDDAGIQFVNGNEHFRPFSMASNASTDGLMDIGSSSKRFKDLYLSGGAYLGGTGAANHLDDYEEGTWTPTITDATNNATMGASNFGQYTKIGRLVICQMYVETTSLGSIAAGSAVYVSGWPFSIGKTGGAVASQASGLAIGANQSLTLSPWASTVMRLAKWDATTGTTNLVASEWSADGAMYITISYEV